MAMEMSLGNLPWIVQSAVLSQNLNDMKKEYVEIALGLTLDSVHTYYSYHMSCRVLVRQFLKIGLFSTWPAMQKLLSQNFVTVRLWVLSKEVQIVYRMFLVNCYLLDILWGQPIKLIQVVSTSEFCEYWWNDIVLIFFCPLGFLQDLRSLKYWLLRNLSMKILDQRLKFLIKK